MDLTNEPAKTVLRLFGVAAAIATFLMLLLGLGVEQSDPETAALAAAAVYATFEGAGRVVREQVSPKKAVRDAYDAGLNAAVSSDTSTAPGASTSDARASPHVNADYEPPWRPGA